MLLKALLPFHVLNMTRTRMSNPVDDYYHPHPHPVVCGYRDGFVVELEDDGDAGVVARSIDRIGGFSIDVCRYEDVMVKRRSSSSSLPEFIEEKEEGELSEDEPENTVSPRPHHDSSRALPPRHRYPEHHDQYSEGIISHCLVVVISVTQSPASSHLHI